MSTAPPASKSDEIDKGLAGLYGEVDWKSAKGVLHVAAIARQDRAVIIPGPTAPASETDRFVLSAARARADAIVTTGAILRSEPDLRHDPAQDPAENLAFLEWRRERLEKSDAPLIVVLSASADLPLEHPAIRGAARGFIWTTPDGAARLRSRVGERLANLEIVEGDQDVDGVVGASRRLLTLPGIETVLVEAGPSASAPLYADARLGQPNEGCSELLLSRYESELAPAAVGPQFISLAAITERFGSSPHEAVAEDSSGEWTVMRYRRD
jgi:riboflavin biosynthesis pyrimidine reductase